MTLSNILLNVLYFMKFIHSEWWECELFLLTCDFRDISSLFGSSNSIPCLMEYYPRHVQISSYRLEGTPLMISGAFLLSAFFSNILTYRICLFKWEYYILFEFSLWTTVLKCLQEVNWGNQSTYLIVFLIWEITEIASLPSIWKIVLCNFSTFLIVNTRAIPVVIGSSHISKIPKVDSWTSFVYRALGWSHRLNILLIVLKCMPCLYIPLISYLFISFPLASNLILSTYYFYKIDCVSV